MVGVSFIPLPTLLHESVDDTPCCMGKVLEVEQRLSI